MRIHPHARARMQERGVTGEEVADAINEGERFPAKFGRTGFRRNFAFDSIWRGRYYAVKQVEVFGIFEEDDWLAITVVAKYF